MTSLGYGSINNNDDDDGGEEAVEPGELARYTSGQKAESSIAEVPRSPSTTPRPWNQGKLTTLETLDNEDYQQHLNDTDKMRQSRHCNMPSEHCF